MLHYIVACFSERGLNVGAAPNSVSIPSDVNGPVLAGQGERASVNGQLRVCQCDLARATGLLQVGRFGQARRDVSNSLNGVC